MRDFLQALFQSGDVDVSRSLGDHSREDFSAEILSFDQVSRLNLAGAAPVLDPQTAAWAARMLYQICQLVALRNLAAAEAEKVLRIRCPSERSASVDYSADLFLRYLPNVHAIAKRAAGDDPLVALIEQFAAEWPLSSIGIDGIEPGPVDSFVQDFSLRQLYVDRIIAHNAFHLGKDSRIVAQIRLSRASNPELGIAIEAQ